MTNNIKIYHWDYKHCDLTGYKNNQIFPVEELYTIIDHILELGLNIMIQQTGCTGYIVHIDGMYKFRQR